MRQHDLVRLDTINNQKHWIGITNSPCKVTVSIFPASDIEMDELAKGKASICNFLPELKEKIFTAANCAWPGIEPKAATSLGSDYWEMYNTNRDNLFYMSLNRNEMNIDGYLEWGQAKYDFSKRKMQSFMFVLERLCD